MNSQSYLIIQPALPGQCQWGSVGGNSGLRGSIYAFGERLILHTHTHNKSFDVFGVVSKLHVTSNIDPSGTMTQQGLKCNILTCQIRFFFFINLHTQKLSNSELCQAMLISHLCRMGFTMNSWLLMLGLCFRKCI